MQMILEFVKPFGSWKIGDIADETAPGQPISEAFGRSIIDQGFAKASTEMAQVRAAFTADSDRRHQETLAEMRALIQGGKSAPKGPPTGGGEGEVNRAIEANRIEHSSSPVDRKIEEMAKARDAGKDCTHKILRMVERVGKPHKYPARMVEHDNMVLQQISTEASEYRFNDNSGEFEYVTTRNLSDGGVETITRTGSDSLSGGATYGFTVKPEWIPNLYKIAREQSVFEPFTRPVPVNQGVEAIWPQFDQFQAPINLNGVMQSAIFGGVTVSFTGEATPRVSSDGKTRQNRFKIFDATAFTAYTRDYVADAYISMDSEITRQIGEAMGWVKDWTMIRGNGIGMPQGYFNANSAITGGPNSGARENANKISSDDLIYMMSRMATMCWPRMFWIANVTTMTQLGILRDLNGTAVYQPNALIAQDMMLSIMKGSSVSEGDLLSSPMGILLGRPIYFSEKVPILGTVGDISLVCPYQYGNATRLGLEMGVSEHFYFTTDLIAYRIKERYTGRSLWPTTYTQADNPTTPASGTSVTNFFLLN
jgi:HK97 family phage major capsid protein